MANPLLLEFLGALARWALTGVFSILLANQVITEDQSVRFIDALTSPIAMSAIVGLAVQLAWSLYNRYWNRKKLVTAMSVPSTTNEDHVEALARSNEIHTPPASMSKHTVPYAVVSKEERRPHTRS